MKDNNKDLIKIPVDLDKYILNGMEDGREILRKEKRKKSIKRASIVAMLALLVTISTLIVKPDIVSAIPIIGKVFEYFIDDYKEYHMKKYQEKGKVVGQTIDKGGNKVTLEQMVIDNNIFVASIIVHSDKLNQVWNDDVRMKYMKEEVRINGTEVICSTAVKVLSEKEAMVILSSNIANLKLDDEVNVDIVLNSITNINNEELIGPWEFNFKASKKIESKELIINEKLNVEAGDLFIEKINRSPISAKIYISGKHSGGEEGRSQIESLNYIVKDDKGNILDTIFGESAVGLEGDYKIQLDITSDLNNVKFIELVAQHPYSEAKGENKVIIELQK